MHLGTVGKMQHVKKKKKNGMVVIFDHVIRVTSDSTKIFRVKVEFRFRFRFFKFSFTFFFFFRISEDLDTYKQDFYVSR